MRAGEFPDGSRVLRAKIDMASPNLNMRDPVMYRILHAEHHRTGDKWCIYPMYDYAHGQSDSLEKVTHSMCTLEFEDHRPLYNWFIQQLGIFPSQQIEFDRLNLTYTLLSKRKLLQLVQEGRVRGWDDPRMPTLSGIRRRGYRSEEHTSELQSQSNIVCRLLLEIKKNIYCLVIRRLAERTHFYQTCIWRCIVSHLYHADPVYETDRHLAALHSHCPLQIMHNRDH